MNEQLKSAWEKLKEYWQNLSPKLRKTILTVTAAVVLLAVGLAVFLNVNGSGMVLLFDGLDTAESQEIYNVLQEQGFTATIDNAGRVRVRRQDQDRALAQLAILNYPSSSLSYTYFTENNGLTTTDSERRQLILQELQDRLQNIITQYDGVKSAAVTLDIPQNTTYPWGGETQKATGSVSLVLEAGYTPTRDQVSGIKYLVSHSVGQNMQPSDVAVLDAATWVNLRSRDDDSTYDQSTERLALEAQIEANLVDKARNVLSIAYAGEDMRLSATVTLDYDKVVTESKQYQASEDSDNNTGVIEHQDRQYTVNGTEVAEGLAGEENNTDTPTYGDQNGDGVVDTSSMALNTDYAVPYVLQQIEKNNADIVSASMAVIVRGTLGADERRAMIELISMATGITQDSISLQSVTGAANTPGGTQTVQPINTTLLILIGAGVALLLIFIITIVLLLRNRKKRKQERAREAQLAKEEEDARLHAQEIEDHKRQLQQLAKSNSKEDAITNEVREFAQENPDIAAGLLRAWLKEDDEN